MGDKKYCNECAYHFLLHKEARAVRCFVMNICFYNERNHKGIIFEKLDYAKAKTIINEINEIISKQIHDFKENNNPLNPFVPILPFERISPFPFQLRPYHPNINEIKFVTAEMQDSFEEQIITKCRLNYNFDCKFYETKIDEGSNANKTQ